MDARSVVNSLGEVRDFAEAMDWFRAQFTARGQASRAVADSFEVSRRTAQRWLREARGPAARTRTGRVRRDQVVDAARRASAAAKIRAARSVNVGVIQVFYRAEGPGAGPSLEGDRRPGPLRISGAMASRMGDLADRIEADASDEEIREAMDVATMVGYFGYDDPDRWPLGIDDWERFDLS